LPEAVPVEVLTFHRRGLAVEVLVVTNLLLVIQAEIALNLML
jgi:hypothetical protein